MADVRHGTRRDALLHAAEANRKHGLQLTNKDKRRIVTLFLNDPEWSKWSDREIARRCGVSNPFVSSLRATLSSDDSEENEARTYITRYGTVATMNVTRIGNDPYEGLSDYVIKELEERKVPPEDIAEIARWAGDYKANINQNAARALLTGSWMLSCTEGDTPHIGDPPYTQERLEKEGWFVWALVPKDIPAFLEIGRLERDLHASVVSQGKDFFDVTSEDMLSQLPMERVAELAHFHTTIMFRCCYTIWHYVTFGMTQEQKEKILQEANATT